MTARSTLALLSACLALSACTNGRNDQAAAACNAEISKRLSAKNFEIDVADLARHATSESADTLLLSSTAVFDKGLSTEYRQTYDCRVRFDKSDTPSVIFLEFNWNKEDLKKAQ
jgi:hypothetical protein